MNRRALAALNRVLACALTGRQGPRSNELVLNTALLLNELLIQQRIRSRILQPEAPETLLEQVGRLVETRLSDGIRIPAIAEHLGYSPSRLRALVRERTGLSLGKYLESARIARAHQLIDMTDMNISEIAYACGYESPAAFSRLFRKHMGMTPREHRKGTASMGT